MKLNFHAESELELTAVRVMEAITKEFPKTFFVGGFVRDLLLSREVNDIDIATNATPEQVAHCLNREFNIDDKARSFGVLRINNQLEITTFREETYGSSRYPKVTFIDSPEADSRRRDFTINGLYMSLEGEILDFHGGITDLGAGLIRFIGDPQARIEEDPLRILRAIRLSLQLDFAMEEKTKTTIQKNFSALATLKQSQIDSEIKKLDANLQKAFVDIINAKDLT